MCNRESLLFTSRFKYYYVVTISMESDIHVSTLEKIIINSCTPVLYAFNSGKISFKEIARIKEDNYKRLIKYLENDGKIPFRVQAPYHLTACGNLAVGTAYMRKYLM